MGSPVATISTPPAPNDSNGFAGSLTMMTCSHDHNKAPRGQHDALGDKRSVVPNANNRAEIEQR
jgi:hypothetical protein